MNGTDVATGDTALHIAATYDYADFARELVRFGCDVSIKNYIRYAIETRRIFPV